MLSPNRKRETLPHSSSSSQISLSTSLSRKMRNHGSFKGGQTSPMFPPVSASASRNGGKRKGGSLESQEPSSPKVTCIGQVRMKKKHGRKKLSPNDSVTQCCISRNAKRAHFPLSICEGFSCLLPCRSGFCLACEGDGNSNTDSRCCGAICGQWVVHDNAKGRKVELVVREEEQMGEREMVEVDEEEDNRRTYRRNVFQEIEFKEVGSGTSIVPPKNALLLMRCRSDPVKVAALAKKFFEAPPVVEDEENDRNMEIDADKREDEKLVAIDYNIVVEGNNENRRPSEIEVVESGETSEVILESVDCGGDETVAKADGGEEAAEEESKKSSDGYQTMVNSREEAQDKEEEDCEEFNEGEGGQRREQPKELPECLLLMMCEPKLSMEVSKETWVCSTDFVRTASGGRAKLQPKKTEAGEERDIRKRQTLIRESAEVSASTVNCSEAIGEEDEKNKTVRGKSNSEKQWKLQPHRSSCHYPSRQQCKESMALAIEKKLVGSNGYEPFVLTRCNSEPMRTAPPRKSDAAAVPVRVSTASGF